MTIRDHTSRRRSWLQALITLRAGRRRIFAVLLLLLGELLLGKPIAALAQLQSVTITQVTVSPNAAAYAAGNCLGGVLPVPGMNRVEGSGGARLTALSVVDPQHQSAVNDAMVLFVFKAAPTGAYTDHAACNIAATDAPNLIGSVSIPASSCVQDQSPTNTVCTVMPNLPLAGALPATSSNIWVVPMIAATPTYGAAASLYFNFAAEPY